VTILHSCAALAVKEEARDLRVGGEGDVLALHSRLEVRLASAPALAVLDVNMVPAGALHLGTVEVLGARVAELDAGINERLRGGIRLVPAGVLGGNRPAVPGTGAGRTVLGPNLL